MRISDWSSDVCSSDLSVIRLPARDGRAAKTRNVRTRIGPIGHEKISFTGGIAAGFPIIGLSRAIFKHGPQPDSLRLSRYERSMHRLFVALRPPPAIPARLLALIPAIAGARRQDDDPLPLTLLFLGHVDRT